MSEQKELAVKIIESLDEMLETHANCRNIEAQYCHLNLHAIIATSPEREAKIINEIRLRSAELVDAHNASTQKFKIAAARFTAALMAAIENERG